jgi:hypothetical protein
MGRHGNQQIRGGEQLSENVGLVARLSHEGLERRSAVDDDGRGCEPIGDGREVPDEAFTADQDDVGPQTAAGVGQQPGQPLTLGPDVVVVESQAGNDVEERHRVAAHLDGGILGGERVRLRQRRRRHRRDRDDAVPTSGQCGNDLSRHEGRAARVRR